MRTSKRGNVFKVASGPHRGAWGIDVRAHGRRFREFFPARHLAERRVQAIKEKRLRPAGEASGSVSLAGVLQEWKAYLRGCVNDGSRSPMYLVRVETSEKALAWFGRSGYGKVSLIGRKAMSDFRAYRMKEGRTARTALNDLRVMVAAINWYIDEKGLDMNPVRLGRRWALGEPKRPALPTPVQLQALFDALPHDDARRMFYGLLATGARFKSLAMLTADDVLPPDEVYENGQLYFRHGVKRNLVYRRSTPRFPFRLPKSGLLFTNGGRQWSQQTLWDMVKRACRRTGVSEITIHTLRHAFATYQLANGKEMSDVMKLGNWRTTELMMRTYNHWEEEYKRYIDKNREDGYLPVWGKPEAGVIQFKASA